jgi:hypothetical protein
MHLGILAESGSELPPTEEHQRFRLPIGAKSWSLLGGGTKKYLAAKPISASLVASPNLSRHRRKWVCTVVSPMASSLDMSRVDLP